MTSPDVRSRSVTTPMATGTPGVGTRTVTTRATTGTPGAAAPAVAAEGVKTAGVTTTAPAVPGLPRGYYTAIATTDVQVMYKGVLCYLSGGQHYRPEYYMGTLVYVLVP